LSTCPAPEQPAGTPRNACVPSVKTNPATQVTPPMDTLTPGWIVADDADPHRGPETAARVAVAGAACADGMTPLNAAAAAIVAAATSPGRTAPGSTSMSARTPNMRRPSATT